MSEKTQSAPSDVGDLIARLEKATGPDRELDALVALAVGTFKLSTSMTSIWDMRECPKGRFVVGKSDNTKPYLDANEAARSLARGLSLPAYTASIDCALTLVPEDWCRSISGPSYDFKKNARDQYVALVREYQDASEFARPDAEGDGRHTVPAIAICIAALRARTSKPNEPSR